MNQLLMEVIALSKAIETKHGQYQGYCPAHDDKHPSLSIKFTDEGPLFHCYAGCSYMDIQEAFRKNGVELNTFYNSFSEMLREAEGISTNNLGGKYFLHRGLRVEKYSNVVFVPSLYHTSDKAIKRYVPAILGIIKRNGETIGLQRVFLTNEGKTLEKKCFGKVHGGHIPLSDFKVDSLHLAEGIETALAISQTLSETTWAAVSANNLDKVIIPTEAKEVHIWADKDRSETGQKAAEKAAIHFRKNGKKVLIHLPEEKIPDGQKSIDWLDILNRQNGTEIIKLARNNNQILNNEDERLVCLENVEAEEVEWLLKPYFPRGKLVVLAGDPGVGKTFIAAFITAMFSSKKSLFIEGDNEKELRVIFLNNEDGLGDTIVPRLEKFGAKKANIFSYDKGPIYLNPDGEQRLRNFCEVERPDLIVMDPLTSFLDGVDMNNATKVRQRLEILVRLASEFNCMILLVAHNNKGIAAKGIHRVSGSVDIVAAARSLLVAVKNPSEEKYPDVSGFLFHEKQNLTERGAPMSFQITNNSIVWKQVSVSLSELDFNQIPSKKSQKTLATEFLKRQLNDGPKAVKDIERDAEEEEISLTTLNRAKENLVFSFRKENKWFYDLICRRQERQDCQDCHESLNGNDDNLGHFMSNKIVSSGVDHERT